MEKMKPNITDDPFWCALLLAAIFDDDLREEVPNRLGHIDTESTVPDSGGD